MSRWAVGIGQGSMGRTGRNLICIYFAHYMALRNTGPINWLAVDIICATSVDRHVKITILDLYTFTESDVSRRNSDEPRSFWMSQDIPEWARH